MEKIRKGFRKPNLLKKWTKIQISNYLKDNFKCSQRICDEVIDIINENEFNESSLFQTYLEKTGGTILTQSNKDAYNGLKAIIVNSEKLSFANDQIRKIFINLVLSLKDEKPDFDKELFFKTLISDLSKI